MATSETKVIAHDVVDVIRSGKVITLPVGMSYDDGIEWLARRRDEDEQEVQVSRVYNFFPSEGAIALRSVLSARYGWVKSQVIPGLFGSSPPQLIGIATGFGKVEQIPFGRFSIPNVRGFVQCGITTRNGLPSFTIVAKTIQQHRDEMEALFDELGREALINTPYKGAAIRLPLVDEDAEQEMEDLFPQFLDVRSASLDQMVFARDIEELLMDNVFGPVMHTEMFRSRKIPLKMGVLLEGEYGCGKTLVANSLAKVCTVNGWTYILCEDPSDLARCVAVARRFEPAVVFCEDIDRDLAGDRRSKGIDKILNTIDGIESKGTEIMVVLTTNHVDTLTPAMRRPGRLDVVVPVGPPDEEAVARMIALYAGDQIEIDADLTEVSKLLGGRTPAVIREVVERAKRTAIVMAGDDDKPRRLNGESLARAARGMRRHLDLLDRKPAPEIDPIAQVAHAIRDLKG